MYKIIKIRNNNIKVIRLKKIILLFLILLSIGCTNVNTATNQVKEYLNSYKNLDIRVLDDLEKQVELEELTEKQKSTYRDILKKQYKDLSYTIEKEEEKKDYIYVTVNIKVYDYYKAQNDAASYLADNMNKFYDKNGKYDSEKYVDYKLEQMQKMNDKIDYTIVFTVVKENDEYTILQPSEIDLEKIHGIYRYDIN